MSTKDGKIGINRWFIAGHLTMTGHLESDLES